MSPEQTKGSGGGGSHSGRAAHRLGGAQREVLMREALILALHVAECGEELPRLHEAICLVLAEALRTHKPLAAAKGALAMGAAGARERVLGERAARHLEFTPRAREQHARARGREVGVHLAMRPQPCAARGMQLAVGGQVVDERAGEAVGGKLLLHDGRAARRAASPLLPNPSTNAATAKDMPTLCSQRRVEKGEADGADEVGVGLLHQKFRGTGDARGAA